MTVWKVLTALFLPLILAAGCYSPPNLYFEYHTRKKEKVYDCTPYEHFTMVRCQAWSKLIRIDLDVQIKEELYKVIHIMNYGRDINQRVPDLTPIRLFLYNKGLKPVQVDYYNFRIREVQSNKIHPALKPAKYIRDYYGYGLGVLSYYWAFEQKDNYRFLHPLPDWLLSRRRDTISRAERKTRRRSRFAELEKLHRENLTLAPGGAMKGYLLFPELPAGRSYVLEYNPGKQAEKALAFPPLFFEIRLTRSGEKVKVSKRDPEKLNNEKMETMREHDEDERRRNLYELYQMHKQLRKHGGKNFNKK